MGGLNFTHSAETIQKIGAKSKGRPSANKGKKASDETKAKQLLSKLGRPNPKLAAARTGVKQSPETCAKRSASLMGIPRPPAVGVRARETHTGKVTSEETRLKQSIAATGRKNSPESIAKMKATRLERGLNKKSPESIAKQVATREHNKKIKQGILLTPINNKVRVSVEVFLTPDKSALHTCLNIILPATNDGKTSALLSPLDFFFFLSHTSFNCNSSFNNDIPNS